MNSGFHWIPLLAETFVHITIHVGDDVCGLLFGCEAKSVTNTDKG